MVGLGRHSSSSSRLTARAVGAEAEVASLCEGIMKGVSIVCSSSLRYVCTGVVVGEKGKVAGWLAGGLARMTGRTGTEGSMD